MPQGIAFVRPLNIDVIVLLMTNIQHHFDRIKGTNSFQMTPLILHLLAGLFSLSAAASTCLPKRLPAGQSVGGVSNVTSMSSGLQRSYLISIPPLYRSKTPTPVIFSYHGGDRTAEDQLQLDQLTNPDFNTRAFVV
jgi:hypothetical protein